MDTTSDPGFSSTIQWFFSNINWLALLVATLAYFMLGALWYSKALFGHKWAALVKLDVNDPNLKKGMASMMVGSFIFMLVACLGIAFLVARINPERSIIAAIKIGLLAGICFASTALSISFIYERKPRSLFFIDCGYHVIGLLLASIILVMWR